MCTIVIGIELHPQIPLFLCANRDEWRTRLTDPFTRLSEKPVIYGGRDLKAGGTWFAIRADRAMAMVTNIRADANDSSTKRTRGELPLRVLRGTRFAEMEAQVARLETPVYNPFHLLFGQGNTWGLASSRAPGEVQRLAPGLHVLGNHALDADQDPKTAIARAALVDAAALDEAGLLERFTRLLGDPRVMVDNGPYGTRWSMAYLQDAGGGARLFIADDGAHRTAFKEMRITVMTHP